MNLSVLKAAERHPLCIDLDGTLVNTDTLVEAILVLLKINLFYLFILPIWVLKGKAKFKTVVFRHAKLNVQSLPYNQNVLALIKEQKELGRPVVLVTASPYLIAEPIADYLGFFSEVLASDENINLKGKAKANLLLKKYGDKGFDYAGNAPVDVHVWKKSHQAFLVNCSKTTEKKAARIAFSVSILQKRKPIIKLVMRQIRVHQWLKNLLIFTPIILSHKLTDVFAWIHTIHAFFSFSLLSSSVYVVNDILDLQADRQHPQNCKRPFASGSLPISWGFVLFPVLFLGGTLLAWSLSLEFFAIVLSYFGLTSAYSLRLKQIPIADILILTSLFSWRVFAGSIASGIVFSEWFFTFAIFFFLSLALVKRCSELIVMRANNRKAASHRGYLVEDLPLLLSLGVGSAYLSILVLALYFNSNEVKEINIYPKLLWAILPLLLFWISRMWLIAWRGKMPTDPLLFTMRDKLSYVVCILISCLWLLAKSW